VLDDHAHREAELERDLTDALAGVAWEIRVLSRALKAVVEGRPVPAAAPPAARAITPRQASVARGPASAPVVVAEAAGRGRIAAIRRARSCAA
jgi:hypothetical protein